MTKTETIVENYHGTDVADPFRWLEKPETLEVKTWVDEQNEATQNYLATYPEREKVKEKLTKSWNYPKYSVPQKEGDYYYFHKNDGLTKPSCFLSDKGFDHRMSLRSLSIRIR